MTEIPTLDRSYVDSLKSEAVKKLNKSSAGSLVVWGLLNLALWLIFGRANVHILSEVTAPGTGLYVFVYSGLILGAGLMMLALIGMAAGRGLAMLLDGFGLLVIGLWNILYMFIAPGILEPYGYRMADGVGTSPIWIMLGISQIIWAFRAWGAFSTCREWVDLGGGEDPNIILGRLNTLLALNASREEQVFRGIIERKGFLGFGNQTSQLVGIVQNGQAYIFSNDMRTILCVGITEFRIHAEVNPSSLALTYLNDGIYVKATLDPASAIIYMELTKGRATSEMISKLAQAKEAPIPILLPYLHDPDPNTRYHTVLALGNSSASMIPDILLKVLLEDEGLPRSGVIEVYIRKGYDIGADLMANLLAENDAAVFVRLLQYIRKFPSPAYVPALEKALSGISDRAVARDVEKLIKACEKARG